jgi:hypothetical protein
MNIKVQECASQISEILFENTSKIPEGVYLELMNTLQKLVKMNDKAPNTNYRLKLAELAQGTITRFCKCPAILLDIDQTDYIDINNCLVSGGRTHEIVDMLASFAFTEDDYEITDIDNYLITNQFKQGKMLWFFTNHHSDYIPYSVGDIIKLQVETRQEVSNETNNILYNRHTTTLIQCEIKRLLKKDMLVNMKYLIKTNDEKYPLITLLFPNVKVPYGEIIQINQSAFDKTWLRNDNWNIKIKKEVSWNVGHQDLLRVLDENEQNYLDVSDSFSLTNNNGYNYNDYLMWKLHCMFHEHQAIFHTDSLTDIIAKLNERCIFHYIKNKCGFSAP